MDIKFCHATLAANICDALQKNDEAKGFAKAALAMPKVIKPSFKEKSIISSKIPTRKLRTLEEILAS